MPLIALMLRPALHILLLSIECATFAAVPAANFANFESAPVHPLDINADESLLAVCNLPDGRVEFLSASNLDVLGSVAVGIDPVSVRFRTTNELWVVNHISDTIDVVDARTRTVTRVILTRDGPADVVFAGSPERAFVSCPPENLILVIDPETGATQQTIPIAAERPKALAVSPDRKKVYAAILESGNGTTILAPRLTGLTQFPTASPIDLFNGPYGGLNPPPNSGTNLLPLVSTNIPVSNLPPRVSLIVKKDGLGRWRDDNRGDWTEFVSGTNAAFSGRVPGWDLIDHDLAIIDANTFDLTFADGLMNICFGVAVNPASNLVAVVGTEALNEIRYEPLLKGVFTRAHLALVGAAGAKKIVDLNPHLDYRARSIPESERAQTIGDPRGAAWNPAGTLLYVTGMGSDNLAVFDATGMRVTNKTVGGGPSGIVLNREGNRLFVYRRFANAVSIVNAASLELAASRDLFDPTPDAIKRGRSHFYDTRKSSGLGQAACASCHVDGRFDRLAWDLGSPSGEMKRLTSIDNNFGAFPPAVTNHFHPMKGPMVTQTLQDIIGHEPFHWRGDRNGLEEFNPTFTELQGADRELSDAEMQEFEGFLRTLTFPPNRFRQFDNSLPRNLALPGQMALGRGQRQKGAQLPNGDAVAGLNFFRTSNCIQCHSLPAGLGTDQVFRNGRWNAVPPGPHDERHVALVVTERTEDLPFKIPHLRSLPEKLGLTFSGTARSGFGFFHDGRVDTLTRFLQDGFSLTDDKQTADVIAFLLAFAGSDLPTNSVLTDPNTAPGAPSRDAPAAVGRQLLASADSTELGTLILRANSLTGRVELVAKGWINAQARGWVYNRSALRFLPDAAADAPQTRAELFTVIDAETRILFTLVPNGTGRRLGIDRDLDGLLDFDEAKAFATSRGGAVSMRRKGNQWALSQRSEAGRTYRAFAKRALSDLVWTELESKVAAGSEIEFMVPFSVAERQRFFMIEVRP